MTKAQPAGPRPRPARCLRRALAAVPLALALAAGGLRAHGQEATERYIPIGRSPGLSGKVTAIGTIRAVDGQVLVLATAEGERRFELEPATPIWIDRSPLGLAARAGGLSDLRTGRRAELRPDPAQPGRAIWLKVEQAAP